NRQAGANGTQHLFGWFCFADLGKRATFFKTDSPTKTSQARLGFACLGPSPRHPQQLIWSTGPSSIDFEPSKPSVGPGQPRKLEIEVRPERALPKWEGENL